MAENAIEFSDSNLLINLLMQHDQSMASTQLSHLHTDCEVCTTFQDFFLLCRTVILFTASLRSQIAWSRFWPQTSPIEVLCEYYLTGKGNALSRILFQWLLALNPGKSPTRSYRHYIAEKFCWQHRIDCMAHVLVLHSCLIVSWCCRHFAFNMIALWSFGVTAARELGVNQFLAFYLTSGLSAALLSDLGRFRSLRGGRSLGASGAVYACFALAALTKPDIEASCSFICPASMH